MQQLMNIKDIEQQFQSEWVLVEDPETDDSLEVLGGIVRHHSKDRDEVYARAIELRPKRSAIVYTGDTPEDMDFLL